MEESNPVDDNSELNETSSGTFGFLSAGKPKKKCPYCSFSSNYAASLTVHLRRHTGEKPYQCPYCTKVLRFSDRSNMNSHIRKYHKDLRPRKNSSFVAIQPRRSYVSMRSKPPPTQKENASHFDYFPLEQQMPVIGSIYSAGIPSPPVVSCQSTLNMTDKLKSPMTASAGTVSAIPQSLNKIQQSGNNWESSAPRINRRKPAVVRKQIQTRLEERNENLFSSFEERLMNTDFHEQTPSGDENLHAFHHGNEVNNDQSESSSHESSSSQIVLQPPTKMEEYGILEKTQSAFEDLHSCQHCDIYFKSLVLHTLHMGCHGYDDPFKCNTCGVRCENAIEFHCHFARGNHNGML